MDFCCVTFLVVQNFPSALIPLQCLIAEGLLFIRGAIHRLFENPNTLVEALSVILLTVILYKDFCEWRSLRICC